MEYHFITAFISFNFKSLEYHNSYTIGFCYVLIYSCSDVSFTVFVVLSCVGSLLGFGSGSLSGSLSLSPSFLESGSSESGLSVESGFGVSSGFGSGVGSAFGLSVGVEGSTDGVGST